MPVSSAPQIVTSTEPMIEATMSQNSEVRTPDLGDCWACTLIWHSVIKSYSPFYLTLEDPTMSLPHTVHLGTTPPPGFWAGLATRLHLPYRLSWNSCLQTHLRIISILS